MWKVINMQVKTSSILKVGLTTLLLPALIHMLIKMGWTFWIEQNWIGLDMIIFNCNLLNCTVMCKMWMDSDKCVYY